MTLSVLLHLTRGEEDRHAVLVERVVSEMLDTLKGTLVRVPTHCMPSALRDLDSDEVLCIRHDGIRAEHIRALRWAAHGNLSVTLDLDSPHFVSDFAQRSFALEVTNTGKRFGRETVMAFWVPHAAPDQPLEQLHRPSG